MSEETRRLKVKKPSIGDQVLPKGAILQERYEILRALGLGGMGYVYQARDLRFANIKRLCAIKEMISTSPDPKFRKVALHNFEREANTLASINHPSVVKIYDYFTEGKRIYLVMEYVEGKDLERMLDELPKGTFLEESRVLKWGIQLCDVLAFLHENETPIVYRDLKPPNVMLRDKGPDTVVLIDFGIAKAFQEGQKGTMMGTEGYSPPEQYRGIASPQGDIYALGATLHHLLTRRDPKLQPPFTFHEAPPRNFNPKITELTEQVIMRSVNYDKDKRFDSSLEMGIALQKALDKNTQPEWMNQMQQIYDTPIGEEKPATPEYQASPKPPEVPAPEISAPNINKGTGTIQPLWKFECEDDVRSSPRVRDGIVYIGSYDQWMYAIDAKSGSKVWKYEVGGGIAASPCLYKDKVIIGSEDNVVYAFKVEDGTPAWTCYTKGMVRSSVHVSEEFEVALFGSDDNHLYVIDVNTGRLRWKFHAGGMVRSTPCFSDQLIFVGSEDNHLHAVTIQGKSKWRFESSLGIVASPVVEGNLVLVGSKDGHFYALSKKAGNQVWRVKTNKPIYSSPRVHGKMVYFGGIDENLYAVEIQSGRVKWKFNAKSHIISTPLVFNDAIYFGTSSGEVISLVLKNGKERWRFQTDGPVPSSPDGYEDIIYIGSTDCHVYALPA